VLFLVATLLAAIAACVQGTIGFGLALTSAAGILTLWLVLR